MIDVLIADESLLPREGLAAVLRQEGMTVVGKVGTTSALRGALTTARPDVALVDIQMLPVDRDTGLSAIELIKREYPDVGVLVISDHFDPAVALGIISRRPASAGYLLKESLPESATLVRAVQVVACGGTFVDRAVIERLKGERRVGGSLDCLSEREREILELMAAGRTNTAICAALYLSPKTVESHVRAVFKKLGLHAAAGDHRRVLAVLRYLQAGVSAAAEGQRGVADRMARHPAGEPAVGTGQAAASVL